MARNQDHDFTIEHVSSVSITVACELCSVERSFFYALVDEGVFVGDLAAEHLSGEEFARFSKAARLFNDLGVNPAGIALVLELLNDSG